MADLMADLLALAGDDDASDDQNESSAKSAAQSPAAPAQAGPVTAHGNDRGTQSPVAEKPAQSPSKSPESKKRPLASGDDEDRLKKKARKEDSEEERQPSPAASSTSTLRSASMSESDSGTDPTTSKANMSKFRVDGRFMSKEEKARIMSLPEIEREELLAERATAVEREKQNRMLMQILKEKERKRTDEAESPDRKRKSGTVDLDDQPRKSTRQKTAVGALKAGEASAPLEAYKREREQRGAHAEQKQRDEQLAKDRGRAKDHAQSDADADGESEGDWAGNKRSTAAPPAKRPSPPTQQTEPPAALTDYNHVKIGRSGFGLVCYYPGFEETMTGCFVRINIGNHPESGEPVYRTAQIKRFTEGRPYALEGPNGRNFVTTKYAVAAHGKAEREWAFIFCSDQKITEAEFERYKRTCAAEGVALPSLSFLLKKNQAIHALIHRKWTPQELQEKLTRSGALQVRDAPIIRSGLRRDRAAAIERGDEAAIARCDKELAALDGPKLAFGTTLYKQVEREDTGPTQEERLAAVNRRNQKLNAIEIRQAQLAEWKQKTLKRRVLRKAGNGDEKSGQSNGASPAGTPEVGAIKLPVVVAPELKTKEGFPMIGRNEPDDEYALALALESEIDVVI